MRGHSTCCSVFKIELRSSFMSVRAPPIGPVIVLRIAEKISPNWAYAPVGKSRSMMTSMLAPQDIAFAFIPLLLRGQPPRSSLVVQKSDSTRDVACRYPRDQAPRDGLLRRSVPPEARAVRRDHGGTFSQVPRSVR